MIHIDLWKDHDFRIKDAVLLCLLEMGLRFLIEFALALFRINLELLYDAAFLGLVLVIARQFGKKELPAIMKRQKVPVTVVCSLIVMYFGMEILMVEITHILRMILPVTEDFFGEEIEQNALMTIITSAVFPAFTEEIFYRGILLKRLQYRYPERKALAASALLFAAMHLNPWQAVTAFIGGLFLGWIYMRFKSIWLCIFFHGYNNVLAYFMSFPVEYLENRHSYAVLVMHPLWFDILGLVLFLAGWGLTMAVAWGESRRAERGVP